MKKSILALAIAATTAVPAYASTSVSGGIWLNHQQTTEDTGSDNSEREAQTLGVTNSEALVLYIDHKQENTNWQLSGEWRTGPGSFSSSANNSTGDTSGFHKLWVGYNFSADRKVIIGKSQVPFGWKTTNFWPGDMGLGGYGDQMDVGVKFSDKQGAINYDLAWFISDDFGAKSTDTMDDNGHWGSSLTYRKVNTGVANIGFELSEHSTIGASYQKGELQDLTGGQPDTDSTFGGHDAWNVWYKGNYGDLGVKAQVLGTTREHLDKIAAGADKIETLRHAVTLSYASGPFNYYIDYTNVSSETDGNNADDMVAFAPGVSYNYGPGWIYAEYLTQSNYLDSNSDVADASGDASKFSALYLTIDYYFGF